MKSSNVSDWCWCSQCCCRCYCCCCCDFLVKVKIDFNCNEICRKMTSVAKMLLSLELLERRFKWFWGGTERWFWKSIVWHLFDFMVAKNESLQFITSFGNLWGDQITFQKLCREKMFFGKLDKYWNWKWPVLIYF